MTRERPRLPRPALVGAALVLAIVAGARCDRGSGPGRVLVLGFDGLDPDVVDLLMSEGRLPHFGSCDWKARSGGSSARSRC